ncbi:MAG: hypothetical protein E4G94_11785, partial [ANME-2 cluster archaeon]
MDREAFIEKLENAFEKGDKKTFIDLIFDLSDDEIVSLKDDDLNRIFKLSNLANIGNVDELSGFFENEGVNYLDNALQGLNEFNNAFLAKWYFGLYLSLFPEKNEQYASALLHKAVACSLLSDYGRNPKINLIEAIKLYKAAQQIFQDGSADYARALMNEANARQTLAERGSEPQQNLQEAIKLYKAAQQIFPDGSAAYALALMNEANARQTLADRGSEPQQNQQEAINLYKAAQQIFPDGSADYARALLNEANARQTLAD